MKLALLLAIWGKIPQLLKFLYDISKKSKVLKKAADEIIEYLKKARKEGKEAKETLQESLKILQKHPELLLALLKAFGIYEAYQACAGFLNDAFGLDLPKLDELGGDDDSESDGDGKGDGGDGGGSGSGSQPAQPAPPAPPAPQPTPAPLVAPQPEPAAPAPAAPAPAAPAPAAPAPAAPTAPPCAPYPACLA